jgi:aminoacrylate peracid reductase
VNKPLVRSVEHVSIAVHDAASATLTFAALGFEPQWTEDLPDQGLRSHVLRAGDVVLELIEPMAGTPAAGSVDRFLERRGEGLHHLCLRVDSVEQAARAAEAAGLRLVDRTPAVDKQGRRVFVHPDSVHGVLIGLVELHRPEPHQPESQQPELHQPEPQQPEPQQPEPQQPVGPADRKVIGADDPEYAGKTYVAAVARAGVPLFVSGLTAAGADGTVGSADVASQARVIFAKLAAILDEAGAGPASVVKTTDYILSRSGYRAVADVRREFFGPDFPAATGVVVKELLGRGVLIEMDAVAIL